MNAKDHLEMLRPSLSVINFDPVYDAIEILKQTRITRNCVWIVGNGGSAATASHFANDLLKKCGVRAVAVSDLTPTLLAFGNDNGWDRMFRDLLGKLSVEGDLVILFSCSGESLNVVKAVPPIGRKCIAFTGPAEETALLRSHPDVVISVPGANIRVQEDIHLILCHSIVRAMEE